MALTADLDPKDLAQAGWGVLFAHDADPSVLDALRPLLDLRKAEATRQHDRHYRELWGAAGYLPGESYLSFLARQGAGPGSVVPERVPYYLLIVGDPGAIPFRFQSQLDVQYAVGRIHFETPDEYARYARSVVEAETKGVSRPARVCFFNPTHPDDEPTRLLAQSLTDPLAEGLASKRPDLGVETVIGPGATKERLRGALLGSGPQPPALVFAAGHGLGFPSSDPRLPRRQGALVCQDWTGPGMAGSAASERFSLSADDIGDEAELAGRIVVAYASFAAGTANADDSYHGDVTGAAGETPAPVVSGLAKRLLGHPRGGLLAFAGLVGRSWGFASDWPQLGQYRMAFANVLRRLCSGWPVGAATEFVNVHYAALTGALSAELEDIRFGKSIDTRKVAGLWSLINDARGFVVVGDPAVRLDLTGGT